MVARRNAGSLTAVRADGAPCSRTNGRARQAAEAVPDDTSAPQQTVTSTSALRRREPGMQCLLSR
jgi:hypothetical protein